MTNKGNTANFQVAQTAEISNMLAEREGLVKGHLTYIQAVLNWFGTGLFDFDQESRSKECGKENFCSNYFMKL